MMAATLSAERELELVELARSAKSDERNAGFAALVAELGPSLLALCLGVTGHAADAEDALQDALCTVAAELSRFRGDAWLYTWCYRITLRAAVRVKAKSRRKTAELTPPSFESPDPFAAHDEGRRLLAAVSQLPLEQRAVLTLFADGRSHDEIAATLDIPTGTVWSRLHLARRRLRQILER
jgi:RNA polymerase sigma-70 factor (ECF subfamily)